MDNPNAPVTQAHLQIAVSNLQEVLSDLESRQNQRHDILRAEMQHLHDDLVERMDGKETKLLQAFYSFAESNQKRLASVETEGSALKSRLSLLEDRVIELEKRLNMPPAA